MVPAFRRKDWPWAELLLWNQQHEAILVRVFRPAAALKVRCGLVTAMEDNDQRRWFLQPGRDVLEHLQPARVRAEVGDLGERTGTSGCCRSGKPESSTGNDLSCIPRPPPR